MTRGDRLVAGGLMVFGLVAVIGGGVGLMEGFTTMQAIEAGGTLAQAISIEEYSSAQTQFKLGLVAALSGFAFILIGGFGWVGETIKDLARSE
ncbi:hypothetical protein Hrd1104_00110 [Halorhabdus sp. CBA1104]|uniref:hypothetical protein n=1 Tax=Halorhabdus sp. CBA1104 TaxID=1380432 RepID=UPI0012B311CA|nr:hypothetical protein [Halorhabdus sp. CBA1104]QGN05848.1 hypothetical protein Hrd1104_00110 [Halorhabdus sp. CBA1104]